MPLSVRARVRALSTKAFASADEEAAAEVGSLAELDELAPAAEAEADAFSAGDAESDDLFDLDAEADIDVPMEPDAFTAPPRTRASFDNGVDPCKIWVGNLPWEVDVDELRNLGEEFGEIIDVTIVRDRMTGRSRGFGFVEFSEPSEATNAINTLNGQEFAGRVLQVNAPLPRGSGPRERPERGATTIATGCTLGISRGAFARRSSRTSSATTLRSLRTLSVMATAQGDLALCPSRMKMTGTLQ